MTKKLRLLLVLALAVAEAGTAAPPANWDEAAFTERILPIFQDNCYKCHSHEAGKMKGGLTLDSRAGWAMGGDGGPAIIPGDPDKSLLIEAVKRLDDDLAMPPKKPLADAEVALLVEWVRAGAPDPRQSRETATKKIDANWWSLLPLTQPRPPKLAGFEHPIDAFLERKRRDAGLKPSLRANPRTLLRRLSYGLHGLPPRPEAVQAFQADSSPTAYESVVDELLDSPHYGERWARHWLDTVHFADTHGCEHDKERPNAWRYRDYVIDRLNADVPWDRFIREQLAADVFYADDSSLAPALGFVGAGPLELSRKGTAPVTFAYLDRDDMVTQTIAAFASSTINCARCHDHKFDPFPREDYYALQAVFAGVDKGDRPFFEDPEIGKLSRHLRALLHAADHSTAQVLLAREQQQASDEWWVNRAKATANWQLLQPDVYLSSGGAKLSLLDDGSVLAGGHSPPEETYVVTGEPKLPSITGIMLEVLPHPSLPKNGPGRAENGNFHLHEIEGEVFEPGSKAAKPLTFASASADFNQSGWVDAHAIDKDPKTAWAIFPEVGKGHYAVFTLDKPLALKPGSRLAVTLKHPFGGKHVIGRFRLSTTDADQAVLSVISPDLTAILQTPPDKRSEDQRLALTAHAIREIARGKIATLPPQSHVYAFTTMKEIRQVHVLNRGSIDKPVAEAHPGALSAIAALPARFELKNPNDEPSRRAALAAWLASPDNPLTWRSIVNRVWHYHFGQGICNTPNDFGRMGGKPSHPELLDWLAVWFRDDAKGSLKQLHRLIVTSQAYQQRSIIDPEAAKIDDDNRLLWRMNRTRLDAGQYRDAVRLASGRLDLTAGGPGIRHFVTAKGVHETKKLNYADYDWSRPEAGRRSIYRWVWRGIPDPFMEAMDFPNLGLLAPSRTETISPLQSLALLNNQFVLYHSKRLADSLLPAATTTVTPTQVGAAFRRIHQRAPTADEQAAVLAYANQHGLAAACRLLFNSNEFLYVE